MWRQMAKCAGPTPLQMGWACRNSGLEVRCAETAAPGISLRGACNGIAKGLPGKTVLQSRTQASNPTMLRFLGAPLRYSRQQVADMDLGRPVGSVVKSDVLGPAGDLHAAVQIIQRDAGDCRPINLPTCPMSWSCPRCAASGDRGAAPLRVRSFTSRSAAERLELGVAWKVVPDSDPIYLTSRRRLSR